MLCTSHALHVTCSARHTLHMSHACHTLCNSCKVSLSSGLDGSEGEEEEEEEDGGSEWPKEYCVVEKTRVSVTPPSLDRHYSE